MKSKAITTMILFLAGIFILALDVVPVAATSDESIAGLWHFDKEFGTALEFDGLNNYIRVNDDPSLGGMTELTVEAWIKWGGSTGNAQYIVSKYLETGSQRGFILGLHSDNTLRMWVSSDGTTASGKFDYLTSIYTPPVGSWVHVAGVFRGGSFIKLFVNGFEVAFKSTIVPMINDNTDVLYIGRYYYINRYHKGVIDEIRISNVAYDTFDLAGPLTADGNTVALWHFDDAPGTTAFDSSGNYNDGTLYNFASSWVDTTLAPDTSTNDNFGTIYGAAWTTAADEIKYGASALSFDGIDDFVEIPHTTSLDITDQITVRAWINLDIVNAGEAIGGTIIRKGAWPIVVPPPAWGFDIMYGKLRAFIYDGGSSYIANGDTVLSAGVWYHVAFTYDGSEVQIYLNGELEGDPASHSMGHIDSTTAPVWIGRKNQVDFFGGKIDEVQIDNRVIIEVDIDIKPGSDPNSINLGEHGLLPVAILGTQDFDVTKIDPYTIQIGGVTLALRGSAKKGKKLAYSYENVNEDEYRDMMIFFDVQELVAEGVFEDTTIALELFATLDDGTPIKGTDSVNIVH